MPIELAVAVTPHTRTPSWRRLAADAAFCALLTASVGAMQLSLPNFFDGDTAYHLVVARLIRDHGPPHAFPWTPFSVMATQYADKEFLFHVLLAPLAYLDANTAARIAGTVLGGGLLVTIFWLLRRARVPHAALWTLLVLVCSSAFLARLLSVRPHLLAIPLGLCLAYACAERRLPLIAAASGIFPFCYTAWHLPVAICVLAQCARRVGGRRWELTPLALCIGAVGCGIVLHPNFPNNVRLFWIQNVEVLVRTAWTGRQGFDLGGEFQPFSLKGTGRYVLIPGALALMGCAGALRWRREDPLALTASFVACAFLLLTLRTQRFIEYLAPFAVWSAALAWRPERARSVLALLGLASLWMLAVGRHPLELMLRRGPAFPDPAPQLLQRVVPEFAQVVTCDWRYTGEMQLAIPNRRFVVALDPVFFYAHDPDTYRFWYETMHAPQSQPAASLRDRMGAEFVLCTTEPQWRPILAALDHDPEATLRAVLGPWHLYALKPAARR